MQNREGRWRLAISGVIPYVHKFARGGHSAIWNRWGGQRPQSDLVFRGWQIARVSVVGVSQRSGNAQTSKTQRRHNPALCLRCFPAGGFCLIAAEHVRSMLRTMVVTDGNDCRAHLWRLSGLHMFKTKEFF